MKAAYLHLAKPNPIQVNQKLLQTGYLEVDEKSVSGSTLPEKNILPEKNMLLVMAQKRYQKKKG